MKRTEILELPKITDPGIVYGKYTGKYMIANNTNVKSLIIGNQYSNKTRALMIPNIMKSILKEQSILTISSDCEIMQATNSFATEHGYKVRVLDFKNIYSSAKWNMLGEIDPANPLHSVNLLVDTFASALKIGNTAEEINALNWMKTVMLFVSSKNFEGEHNMRNVIKFFTEKDDTEILNAIKENGENTELSRMHGYAKRANNYLIWHQSSIPKLILPLLEENVIDMISKKGISTKELTSKKEIIYIISDEKLGFLSQAFLLFALIQGNIDLYIDDMQDLGYVASIPAHINDDINIMLSVESLTDIRTSYSEREMAKILAACEIKVMAGCNDIETAQYFSDISGFSYVDEKPNKKDILSYRDIMSIAQDKLLIHMDEGVIYMANKLIDIDLKKI